MVCQRNETPARTAGQAHKDRLTEPGRCYPAYLTTLCWPEDRNLKEAQHRTASMSSSLAGPSSSYTHPPTAPTEAASASSVMHIDELDLSHSDPLRKGAAYSARSWRTLQEVRSGGTGATAGLRLPLQHKLKSRALGDQIRRTGFSYMRPLEGHISCINALSFSPDGRWLASAGDDMRVQIRDMYEDVNAERFETFVTLPGHKANIFTLAWSCDGQHLFSGGHDGCVYQYDISTLSNLAKRPRITLDHAASQSRRSLWGLLPTIPPSALLSSPVNPTGLEFLLGTTGSIREVSAHPCNPALLLACTQSGTLTLNDIRVPAPSVVGRARLNARRGLFALGGKSFAGVQWRPLTSDGNTFATCVSHGSSASTGRVDIENVKLNAGTRLYDARMCFGSSVLGNGHGSMDFSDEASSAGCVLNDTKAVMVYDSVLERFERRGEDEVRAHFAMVDGLNVRFDPTGEFLVSDVTGFKPIIYSINHTEPIAVCEAKGYATRCTTKHGSFGRFGTAWEDWARESDVPQAETDPARIPTDELGAAARERIAASTLPSRRVEPDGLYYVTGSDDFRGYGWAIPPLETLLAQRSQVEELRILRGEVPAGGVHFVSSNGSPTWVPRLREPAFTLEGAQSITNTTLTHPHLPLIATSGIERLVRLYSPLPFSEHDDLPSDGTLSVPLLKPGLTRRRGKKPYPPQGANDELDSIYIAQTLLAHQPADDGAAASERTLRLRQLCREGDVHDATTINQFDKYLLDDERERREKRKKLAKRMRALNRSRARGDLEADEEDNREQDAIRELFSSKPDLVYRLRRVFSDIRRGSEGTATVGSALPSSVAMEVGSSTGSQSSASSATSIASSVRGATRAGAMPTAIPGSWSPSSSSVQRAKRPWRRTSLRTSEDAEAERIEESAARREEVGDEAGPSSAFAARAAPRVSASPARIDSVSDGEAMHIDGESNDEGQGGQEHLIVGVASEIGESSSGLSTSEDDDELGLDEPDDSDYDATITQAAGGSGPTHDWLLRAARRLGLQQLSAQRPSRLSGGVWEVRQYTAADRSADAAFEAGNESAQPVQGFFATQSPDVDADGDAGAGADADAEAGDDRLRVPPLASPGGNPNAIISRVRGPRGTNGDRWTMTMRAGRVEFTRTREGQADDIATRVMDERGPPWGREQLCPQSDKGRDGPEEESEEEDVEEYQRWMAETSGQNAQMNSDDDDDEDEDGDDYDGGFDDEDGESEAAGVEDGGAVFDNESDAGDGDDDPSGGGEGVAYRRLGRERP
ncbi:hypothetical protein V8E36_000250 [Tilletia maclaganii]